MKVREIKDYLNELYPFENKCDWDNCGLLVGDEETEITKIGFALDLTFETLEDAKNNGVNLIVTHHPVIFHAQKSFVSGNIAYEAALSGMSVISCHTCYDSAKGGVSEILADAIGLSEIETVVTEETPYCVRIGKTDCVSPEVFALNVASALSATVRFAKGDKNITKAAVCGGAGGDFITEVASAGADAYVTGDMSHHEFLLAQELGLTVIAAGHFETEIISVLPLLERVKRQFPEAETVLLRQNNPVTFVSAEEG